MWLSITLLVILSLFKFDILPILDFYIILILSKQCLKCYLSLLLSVLAPTWTLYLLQILTHPAYLPLVSGIPWVAFISEAAEGGSKKISEYYLKDCESLG